MKKLTALTLAAVLALGLAACGKTAEKEPEATGPETALDLMNTVWESYPEEERFAVIGGDFGEENNKDGAPGVFGIEDAEALDNVLGFPTAMADQLVDASSMIFMMNANTFTAGAYHLKSDADVNAVAEQVKENVLARQWMCGFPDKLLIFTDGSYLVSVWGKTEMVDPFRDKLAAAFPNGSIYYDGDALLY